MRILIAEDDPISSKVLQMHLEKWEYEVRVAPDGMDALDALQGDKNISLLITDWKMPRMDGLELCRLARGLQRKSYLHIIMLTAKGDKRDLLDGMEAGADAFLTKPFDPAALRAQIRVAERVIKLEQLSAGQLKEISRAHARIKRDLEAAAHIQQSLLPQDLPQVPGLVFSWVFDSCDEVAGDTFNVFRLDENHVGVYILDVSGHGVQAALLSVTLSRVLTPLPQTTGFLKRITEERPHYEISQPREVIRDLNERFPVLGQSNQFFTFLYGILHLPTRVLTYSRAGHPYPILIRNGQASVVRGGQGPPIGFTLDAEYDQQQLELRTGDQVLFYTDGICEARDEQRDHFGEERMLQALGSASTQGIEQAVKALHRQVLEFVGPSPRMDDISMVGFELQSRESPDQTPGTARE